MGKPRGQMSAARSILWAWGQPAAWAAGTLIPVPANDSQAPALSMALCPQVLELDGPECKSCCPRLQALFLSVRWRERTFSAGRLWVWRHRRGQPSLSHTVALTSTVVSRKASAPPSLALGSGVAQPCGSQGQWLVQLLSILTRPLTQPRLLQ